MLYSLPSRELIADSVEYMVNAHCADAMVCISNCDKITPGMLMASLRLNIPVIFVSGTDGSRETKLSDKIIKLDLVDAMIQGAGRKSLTIKVTRWSVPPVQPAAPAPACLPLIP